MRRERREAVWLTLLTAPLLKGVMGIAHDHCICVSLFVRHLFLFVAVVASLFGENPVPYFLRDIPFITFSQKIIGD